MALSHALSYFRQGISLRTDRYRLTGYYRTAKPTVELYDYLTDPHGSVNIAQTNPELVNSLMPTLRKGNTELFRMP